MTFVAWPNSNGPHEAMIATSQRNAGFNDTSAALQKTPGNVGLHLSFAPRVVIAAPAVYSCSSTNARYRSGCECSRRGGRPRRREHAIIIMSSYYCYYKRASPATTSAATGRIMARGTRQQQQRIWIQRHQQPPQRANNVNMSCAAGDSCGRVM